ncbi:MAG TPA: rod shape-determining protein MreD [Actinobacteria bacterium]|nr:rod shape-determining protein MreD [Actinomycetota bacterium]
MKYFLKIIHFFILVFFIIFQIIFGEQLEIYHISFDFILITLAAATLRDGFVTGMIFAFISGMIFDLLSGTLVGVSPLIFSLCVFVICRLISTGLKLRLLSYIFIVIITTEINIILLNIMYYLFNFQMDFLSVVIELVTKPLFNILLVFIIFPLFRLKFSGEDTVEYQFR